MRGNGGLYSIVHTTYSTVAVMRIGQAGFMSRSGGVLKLQAVAELYGISSQLGLEPASHT